MLANRKQVCIRVFIMALLFSLLILSATGCEKKTESIEIINATSIINVGDRLPLQAALTPADAANQDVIFTSSDESIATIDGNIIFAITEGTVTITAQQEDVRFDTFSLQIKPVLATGIMFHEEAIDLGIGRSVDLSADLIPKNTTDKGIVYTSSDASIAAINGTTLKAVSEGEVIITATHATGISTQCAVKVSPVLAESIEIAGEPSLNIKSTETLSITFHPEDVTDKTVTWKSSSNSILSIVDGVITAKKIGTAIITATHSSGMTATKEIEVTPIPVEKVTISSKSGNVIYAKEEITLTAVVLPEDATDQKVTWSSNNTSIATIKNGKVTGVSAGTTIIRATTSNQKEDTYTVTVKSSTQDMIVTISCYCSDYNHVGNEWGESFSVNGKSVNSGSIISVTRNKNVNVYSEIIEYDKYSDVGSGSYSMIIKPDYFDNGFWITLTVYVYENNGRYSGNVAEWTVEYEFSPK